MIRDYVVDTGARKELAEHLSTVLANSYMLYLQTQNFHWNVEGPTFHSLHEMFEEQYTELAGAVDTIAERIRALGRYAIGTFEQFKERSTIVETTDILTPTQMLRGLIKGQEAVIEPARKTLKVAEEAGDEVTVDLMIDRLRTHEKNAWMLKATLGREK